GEQVEIAAYRVDLAADVGPARGTGDLERARPFRIEPAAAHEDARRHGDLDIETEVRRVHAGRLGLEIRLRRRPSAAALDHFQVDDTGRQIVDQPDLHRLGGDLAGRLGALRRAAEG